MPIRSLLTSLKYAGSEDLPEYDITRGICIGVNVMCVSIILLNLFSGLLFYLLSQNLAVLIGAYVEAILVLGIIFLNKRKKFELANTTFYSIIILATFYFSAILGQNSETQLMILFILGLVFFIFGKRRMRIFCIGLTLLLLILLEANYIYGFIKPASFTPLVTFFIRWLVYAVVISLVLLIFHLYRKNTTLLIQLHTYSKQIQSSLSSEEKLNELKNIYFQSISHDIRGAYVSLGTICSTIHEKMQAKEPLNAKIADALIDASEHYKFMLNYFLEVSKFKNASVDSIQLESFNVKKEIENIVHLHKYTAIEKDVQVEILSSFGFPEFIVGDRLKVLRIVYSLLLNALKFTRNNSVIQIRIGHNGYQWHLAISDQGKGIPSMQLDKIFDPYITEKSSQNPEGVGLGLYITKRLAEILNANITVDSQLGKGTTFTLQFPLVMQLST